MGAFKYYVSVIEGGGGVSDKLLTLLTLGSGGVGKSGPRAEIKRKQAGAELGQAQVKLEVIVS